MRNKVKRQSCLSIGGTLYLFLTFVGIQLLIQTIIQSKSIVWVVEIQNSSEIFGPHTCGSTSQFPPTHVLSY